MATSEEGASAAKSANANEVLPESTSSSRLKFTLRTKTSGSSASTISPPETTPASRSPSAAGAGPSHVPAVDDDHVEFGPEYYAAFDPVVRLPEEWIEARPGRLVPINTEQNPYDVHDYVRLGVAFHCNGPGVRPHRDCDAARWNQCLSPYENEYDSAKGKGRILQVRWRKAGIDGFGRRIEQWGENCGHFCIKCIKERRFVPAGYDIEFRRGLHAYLLPPAEMDEMHPDGKPMTEEERENKEKRRDEEGLREGRTVIENYQKNGDFLRNEAGRDPKTQAPEGQNRKDSDETASAGEVGEVGETREEGQHAMTTRARAKKPVGRKRRLEDELNEEADRKRERALKVKR